MDYDPCFVPRAKQGELGKTGVSQARRSGQSQVHITATSDAQATALRVTIRLHCTRLIDVHKTCHSEAKAAERKSFILCYLGQGYECG